MGKIPGGRPRGRPCKLVCKSGDTWKDSATDVDLAAHVAGYRFLVELQVPAQHWAAISCNMSRLRGFHSKGFKLSQLPGGVAESLDACIDIEDWILNNMHLPGNGSRTLPCRR
jgi:hypothetical protein